MGISAIQFRVRMGIDVQKTDAKHGYYCILALCWDAQPPHGSWRENQDRDVGDYIEQAGQQYIQRKVNTAAVRSQRIPEFLHGRADEDADPKAGEIPADDENDQGPGSDEEHRIDNFGGRKDPDVLE